MKFTELGTETAEAIKLALGQSSAPRLAKKGGCGVQSIYDVRDGHLPGRLLIPALARALSISSARFAEMVARDRSARALPHAPRRTKAGAA